MFMLVIIKLEGLSLRLVFLLIVVILIHIRSMIKQTAVMPNFPPCSHPLFCVIVPQKQPNYTYILCSMF